MKSDKNLSILLLLGLYSWIFSVQDSNALPSSSNSSPKPITNFYKDKNQQNYWTLPTFIFDPEHSSKGQVIQSDSWNYFPGQKEESWNWENKLGSDDKHIEMTSSIVTTMTYIGVTVVILSFIAFLICLCCPICVLSKLRQRRRGHIYATRQAVTIPVTATNTITTTHTAQMPGTGIGTGTVGPQVIAITNPQRLNSPYPVQPSVTVIPLVIQQQYPPGVVNYVGHPPTYMNSIESNFKTNIPNPTDLPPPYPGLPDVDSNSSHQPLQSPYNPHFDGNSGTQSQNPSNIYTTSPTNKY